jgi:hypothetical protein
MGEQGASSIVEQAAKRVGRNASWKTFVENASTNVTRAPRSIFLVALVYPS